VKIVSEATKEELEAAWEEFEAALAALDEPYKPLINALKDGKRVRCTGGAWRAKGDIPFNWVLPPEDYEIEPEYCGYSEEQWQFVIDGGFDVMVSDFSDIDLDKKIRIITNLKHVDASTNYSFMTTASFSRRYCHIVRRKNHPQPAFGRSVKGSDTVVVHYTSGCLQLKFAEDVHWGDVDWFINLSNEG